MNSPSRFVALFLLFAPAIGSAREAQILWDLQTRRILRSPAVRKEQILYTVVDSHAEQDPYIRRCLRERSSDAPPVGIQDSAAHLCRKVPGGRDVVMGNPVWYSLRKSAEGRIVLSDDLYFKYAGEPRNEAAVIAALKKAKGCMSGFFARHGILLDLSIHMIPAGSGSPPKGIPVIGLWDSLRQANVANWPMLETDGVALNDSQACAVATHEFGHILGLPDTFPDENCPDRPTIGPIDDLMRDGWSGIDKARFYPEEIQTLLAPLCSP